MNEDLDQKSLLQRYEKELRQLKQELQEKTQNVVDKRKLLEIDELRRQAEADKMLALQALEARSQEFMKEKEEKRKLELRIANLVSQIDGDEGDHSARDRRAIGIERHEYKDRLMELEREREAIEAEKAQVDRYKQLILKQRDIMIALTQRLVERDEQNIGLQNELDSAEAGRTELEEQLDVKTDEIIRLERRLLEVCFACRTYYLTSNSMHPI